MAGSSVHIIRGGSSTEYLADAFRDGIILVVIDLESKQVDPSQWKDTVCPFCNSNRSEDENHFLLDCKVHSKIRDVLFSKIELKLPNFKSVSHDTLIAQIILII